MSNFLGRFYPLLAMAYGPFQKVLYKKGNFHNLGYPQDQTSWPHQTDGERNVYMTIRVGWMVIGMDDWLSQSDGLMNCQIF